MPDRRLDARTLAGIIVDILLSRGFMNGRQLNIETLYKWIPGRQCKANPGGWWTQSTFNDALDIIRAELHIEVLTWEPFELITIPRGLVDEAEVFANNERTHAKRNERGSDDSSGDGEAPPIDRGHAPGGHPFGQ